MVEGEGEGEGEGNVSVEREEERVCIERESDISLTAWDVSSDK